SSDMAIVQQTAKQNFTQKDPYLNESYFPYGLGQLTTHIGTFFLLIQAGKRREFSIGTALRSRYQNFLGEFYYPDIVEAISTDYNRTKMSLELVLAGLFPPRREEMLQDNIYWQPVPYNYVPRSEDKITVESNGSTISTLPPPKCRPNSKSTKKIFDYISVNSGLNITRFLDVYNLYFGLSTETEYGFPLPRWTRAVWPDIIVNLAIKEYYVSMATPDMKKMAAGYLLRKIVENARDKITGKNAGRKVHLYSAHENNIAELLLSLGVFEPHIPNYGAYAVIEVRRINNVYGIQILYENYDGIGPRVLTMPGCDTFCPLDHFEALIMKYFPTDDLCGNLE
ncbi:hypothetical protein NQ317_018939, partial [Molorchus minor]